MITIKNTKKAYKIKAFTLVELIIVITILAILASIAFVSFSEYTKSTRDANRLSTLTNIDKGLQTFAVTTGKYPIPDESINITDSGSIIGYQGVVGESVSRSIQTSKIPLDPLDGEKYVYASNSLGKKYQLMTFLEVQNTQTAFVSQSYADNLNRFPTVQGDNLGIILDENNVPIKTEVNIRNHTGSILKVFVKNNKILSGTGQQINTVLANYKLLKTWKELDPNCDVDDIVIGNQVWAGCNSTLGKGTERGYNENGTIGSIMSCTSTYDGVTYSTSPNLEEKCGSDIESMRSNFRSENSIISQNTATVDGVVKLVPSNGVQYNIWGKFYSASNGSSACPSGWRVPTLSDMTSLTNSLGCSTGWPTSTCSGLGWKDNHTKTEDNNIVKALKIPLSGYVNSSLSYLSRGNIAMLMINDSNYNKIMLQRTFNTVAQSGLITSGISVRCIKE